MKSNRLSWFWALRKPLKLQNVIKKSQESATLQTGESHLSSFLDAASASKQDSRIQRVYEEVLSSSQLRVSLQDVLPVTVVAVERYLAEIPPASNLPQPPASASPPRPAPLPSYCYDVTITDGMCQEKCHLAHEQNFLLHKNILQSGSQVKITQCSYMYNEKKLACGFLCIESLEIVGMCETPNRQKEYSEKLIMPLKGGKKHYLPLWNNEDPYGDMWVQNRVLEEATVNVAKLISLSHLETSWRGKINYQPLLVRILHKSRLRYYGKPYAKADIPYQAYFEVADNSGMMSMVLWNSLCPEWYNIMKVGTVLLIEKYAVKTSYPFKTLPTPGDSQMKRFATIEINLNVRDPPTKINIIPEKMVKPEWNLPDVKYRFITRSELDSLPTSHSCDIIGLVRFVGRAERTRKREHGEDFWIHRWAHVVDGTSEQPFILELFATSQPDIFEHIHPMTYLVCTQMRVVRDVSQNASSTLYLTTSNESQMFVTGWHKGQPYAKDTKVKSFIQWIKTQREADHMEKTAIGGYYPFPPAPHTFVKYCNNNKVESVLTTISEMEKEIENLHYREHKRIAIQGIISVIRYVSCSSRTEDSSGPSNSHTAVKNTDISNDGVKKGERRHHQDKEDDSLLSSQYASPQEQYNPSIVTRKNPVKRKLEMSDASESEESEGTVHDSWQSDLWTRVKDNLKERFHYSNAFPESIPRKFDYMHKEFLMEQYNLHPAQHKPKEYKTKKAVNEFKSADYFGQYEVTILGINHDVAIDVAFLPVHSPEDLHIFYSENIQNDTLLSHMSWVPTFPVLFVLHTICVWLLDEIIKAAIDLERQHVICILDICHLAEDKVEVFLNKIYKIVEDNMMNQT
uniref:RPA1 related single stranded DNA binding protein, X-linked n=1 Tax=Sphenodon punctatus TaxID=8508 RepID=A0A8D0HBV5_SPHPU